MITINLVHLILIFIPGLIAQAVMSHYYGKRIGYAKATKELIEAGWRRVDTAVVWEYILRNLSNDNNVEIPRNEADYKRALPGLRGLIAAGFFKDDPYDIDGSYWMLVAGEEEEARKFFLGALQGYDDVCDTLTDILKRGN